jgi:hypothetical protein
MDSLVGVDGAFQARKMRFFAAKDIIKTNYTPVPMPTSGYPIDMTGV